MSDGMSQFRQMAAERYLEKSDNEPKKEANKHDGAKPPISLCPAEGLRLMALAMGYGAKKYGAHNYRLGMAVSRLYSAALRHLVSDLEGERIDPESGQPHLAHALASLAMAAQTLKDHPSLDDRYKKE
jgi:hypothetical protein